jgi:hypothetical protein
MTGEAAVTICGSRVLRRNDLIFNGPLRLVMGSITLPWLAET